MHVTAAVRTLLNVCKVKCFKYMFIGEPGGSIEAGSLIEAGGSDTIVLIEARGLLLEEIRFSHLLRALASP